VVVIELVLNCLKSPSSASLAGECSQPFERSSTTLHDVGLSAEGLAEIAVTSARGHVAIQLH
jgi:hypothetical protein